MLLQLHRRQDQHGLMATKKAHLRQFGFRIATTLKSFLCFWRVRGWQEGNSKPPRPPKTPHKHPNPEIKTRNATPIRRVVDIP
jgi:hypothetical protein